MKKSFLLQIITNKYFILSLVMVMWIVFFDANSYRNRQKIKQLTSKLEEEKVYYQESIEHIKTQKSELLNNPETLERFAREKYLMKKEDEVLFILQEGAE